VLGPYGAVMTSFVVVEGVALVVGVNVAVVRAVMVVRWCSAGGGPLRGSGEGGRSCSVVYRR